MSDIWPRIFIVDDDLSFGRSLVRLLRARGYPAEAFSSARSFLESLLELLRDEAAS